MFLAVQENDLELVKYYMKHGVGPNYQHPEFMTTALIESISLGHLEIALCLLENGADPNLKEDFGNHTPFRMAQAAGNKDAMELVGRFQSQVSGD